MSGGQAIAAARTPGGSVAAGGATEGDAGSRVVTGTVAVVVAGDAVDVGATVIGAAVVGGGGVVGAAVVEGGAVVGFCDASRVRY